MTPPDPNTLDRRPLKSRQWPVIQRAATGLAARRITPNAISIAGMIGGVLAGVCLAATWWVPADAPLHWPVRLLVLAAAAFIQFRLLCNLLDGLVAVEGNMRSPVGEIYNEVPDRISDAATLIGAGYALHSHPTLGYVAAVVALLVAYIRAVGKGCGLPYDFAGPMAKQHRMAAMTLACLLTAAVPGLAVAVPGAQAPTPLGPIAWALAVIVVLGAATALRRVARLARNLREKPTP